MGHPNDGEAPLAILIGDASFESVETQAAIADTVEVLGFTLRRVAEKISSGASIRQVIADDLQSAAVVLALINDYSQQSTWFELGMAAAFERPIVVICTGPGSPRLPSDIASMITVGPVVTQRGLSLAIKRATRRRSTPRIEPPKNTNTGVPLGEQADEWLRRLFEEDDTPKDASSGYRRYLRYEDWFADLLAASGVPFESARGENSSNPSSRIDFVVTAEELTDNLGNLLPIELLASRHEKTLIPALRSRVPVFRQHLIATGASIILVVARELSEPPQILKSWEGLILLCGAADLVNTMRDCTFGNAVLKMRNEAVHLGDIW